MKQIYNRIRLPEYTGENRCIPCTVINLVIAAVVSGLIGLISVPGAVASFAIFAGIIYVRGYLVPGTPTLTKRYFPDRVLQWFDKEPRPRYTVNADVEDDLDIEAVLIGAGALEESANPGDLMVTPTFKEKWHSQIDQLDETIIKETLADVLDVSETQLSMEEYSKVYALIVDGVQIGRWESEAAFRGDIAAGIVLEERIEGWNDLTVEQQTGLMRGLRVFLEQCPDCGGPVAMTEETVESCCSSKEVLVSTCQKCGARLFEINAARVELEGS